MQQLLVGEIFRQCARAVPERMAVAVRDERLSFAELDERSERAADWLLRHCRPGDRVAMWTETCVDAAVLFAATSKAGLAFCPLSPAATDDEMVGALAVIEPAVIVTNRGRRAAAGSLVAPFGATVVDWESLAAHDRDSGTPVTAPGFADDIPQLMVFTSGTTGVPKAAMVSHRAQFLRTHPGAQFEPRGRSVCVYPLFHVAPWLIALQQWHARDGVIFTTDTNPDTIADAVADHAATRLNMIPALWRRMIEYLDGEDRAISPLATLRFADTGTSATPLSLLQAIRGLVVGANVRVFYGSTEAGNVCGLEDQDIDAKPGSVGVPSVSTDVRLDETGELLVRSPLLFDGYFNNPSATEAAISSGWYRTGDLAEIDDEGYLYIVGRVTELIRSGGEAVAPAEVENVLRAAPGVTDVAVVGIPDLSWGELVCAVVVAEPGHTPELADLQSFCDGRISSFKHPRKLVLVDNIPRTQTTGQPQRPLIVDLVTSEQADPG
ncbi:MAG: acyl--CoA ligase [Acidimicrobiaceae bacterium]|nr:acyl--CoA ligase [Acidimicrobiaceae bacterium]MXW77291.1 acyl--CoA ligase [Acidimicrobiaceae bacterium]MYA75748.1 acyl--CoA ligase [Acidimicrobiaceae bacterium]MYC41280.1 acyl--CoA ligase [Acidimicrobiaceae bacterium]MYD08107.1 acyl--CoA ligase [Acidimicrobiaceae bacterium]